MICSIRINAFVRGGPVGNGTALYIISKRIIIQDRYHRSSFIFIYTRDSCIQKLLQKFIYWKKCTLNNPRQKKIGDRSKLQCERKGKTQNERGKNALKFCVLASKQGFAKKKFFFLVFVQLTKPIARLSNAIFRLVKNAKQILCVGNGRCDASRTRNTAFL